jgi:hypothetical protein
MTSLVKLKKILEICEKYSDPTTGLCAEHDVIYCLS